MIKLKRHIILGIPIVVWIGIGSLSVSEAPTESDNDFETAPDSN
jgi:hypothetical protein